MGFWVDFLELWVWGFLGDLRLLVVVGREGVGEGSEE